MASAVLPPEPPRNRPGTHHVACFGLLAVFALLALLGPGMPRVSAEAEEGQLLPRRILALHDGHHPEPHTDFEHLIVQMAEMPLNHLGYVVSSWSLSQGEPPRAWGRDRVAVLTWFTEPEKKPSWLMPWLEAQRAQGGARFLHLGEPPINPEQADERAALNRWLAPFDLEWREGYLEGISRVTVDLDPDRCCYESDPRRNRKHRGPVSQGTRNDVWVTTRDRLQADDTRAAVVIGPWGAVALAPWVAMIGDGSGTRRWHLDPFAFFRAALGTADRPAPDPMVQFGRRVFLFHVDGDGFESVSNAIPGRLSGEVFRREIVERFPIPMTISLIVRSLSDTMTPTAKNARFLEAGRLVAPAHVEAGSHGVVHPFDWSQQFTGTAADLVHFAYLEPDGFDYTQVGEATLGSAFLEKYVMLDGKPVTIMLWTGECRPSHAAVEAVVAGGRQNINGGTFRWDAQWDSVGYVSPFARRAGTTWQVFAGAANEAEFPGFFKSHPAAFGHVAHTIMRTGKDRILKPANVYAHIYSAEQPIRLRTLQRLITRFAYKEATIPLFASTYCRGVVGALEAELLRYPDGFGFRKMGGCRTLRFDTPVRIDLAASEGLLGYRTIGSRTFVHLAAPQGRIRFGAAEERRVYLEEANHPVALVHMGPEGLTLKSGATHERLLVIAGLPPKTSVRWNSDEQSQAGFTDEAGRLTIRLDAGGAGVIEVGRH